MRARLLALLPAALLPLVDLVFAQPPQAKPRKVAFLVGVGKYDHKFPNLGTAPENDAAELARELAGFEVVTLTGSKPDNDPHRATKKNIEARFKELLEGKGGARPIRDGDTVLVLLCGHGVEERATDPDTGKKEKDSQPFFCPVDARPDDTSTMVPLNALIRASEGFGGTSLFLVDACREVPPDPNRGARTGIQGKKVNLPDKTAVLFACGSGQLSHQSDKLDKGHGLFTFAVLKTLKAGGRVTWTGLVNGVENEFESDALKAHIPDGRVQQPVAAMGQLGTTELLAKRDDLAKKPEPGEERPFEITDGVKMRFCWVPAGKATLGSPKDEKDRSENEGDRAFETKGFWMGKFEVTQAEWEKVMGKNPSAFAATGADKDYRDRVAGMDTTKFPVEHVSWDDIQPFLKKLNERAGARAAFGKAGRFALPHEDEWEYAARGGHKDRRPFYWGTSLNGSQANVDGELPYGTDTKGDYLKRPTPVGSYEAKFRHPWGLCDMHGNVWEWCENKYEQSNDRRVVRGGSWHSNARSGRAAYRDWVAPAGTSSYVGFRVLFRLD
jgi:sulfatase modifying factor 1